MLSSNNEPSLASMIKDGINEALKQRGRVNILIAGKTGSGKSTLVNAVFQGDIAETGQGKPVTKKIKEISKEGIPVRIIDTKGLEVEKYEEIRIELEEFVKKRRNTEDHNEHIHAAWVCITEDSRRVEDAEVKLVKFLSEYMPVIAVITKARQDNGFRDIVEKELDQVRNVVRVRAIYEELDEGQILNPMGLDKLVNLTMELVPDSQKNAFAAAQKVIMELKISRARQIMAAAAVSAGVAGATPIPFSDAVVIVPIQIGMLAGISSVFGLKLDQAFLSTLISSTITGVGASAVGRAIVGGLLKLIPGFGSFVGGAISATTAIAITTIFGEAYIQALAYITKTSAGGEISPEDIARVFKENLAVAKQ